MNSHELIQKLEESNIRWRPYSGRGMFGRHCIGVALRSSHELWTLAQAVPSVAEPVTDGLGLGIIAYWPSKEVPPGVKGSDDDYADDEDGDEE